MTITLNGKVGGIAGVPPAGGGGGSATLNPLTTSNSFVPIGINTTSANTSDGIVRDSAGTPIPAIALNVVPRTDTLANLLAIAGNVGEIASATDSNAIVKFNGVVGGAKAIYPNSATSGVDAVVTTTPANNTPGNFTTNLNFTVGTHFTDNASAMAFMRQCTANPGIVIRLTLVSDRTGTGTYLSNNGAPTPWLFIKGSAVQNVPFTATTFAGSTDTTRTVTFVMSSTNSAKFQVGDAFGVGHTNGVPGGSTLTGTNAINLVGAYIVTAVTSGAVTSNYYMTSTVGGTSYLPGSCSGNIKVYTQCISGASNFDPSYYNSTFGLALSTINMSSPSYGNYTNGTGKQSFVDSCLFTLPSSLQLFGEVLFRNTFAAGVSVGTIGSGQSGGNLSVNNCTFGLPYIGSTSGNGIAVGDNASCSLSSVTLTAGNPIGLGRNSNISADTITFNQVGDSTLGVWAIDLTYPFSQVAMQGVTINNCPQFAGYSIDAGATYTALAKNTRSPIGSIYIY